MNAKGTFEVSAAMQPPYDVVNGVTLGRGSFEKRFSGPLDASSHVEMLGARTPVEGSAGYVALERVAGSLAGRAGTFVLLHAGTMCGGDTELTVTVVPDSGTGDLRGLRGQMKIDIVDGQHHYDFEYEI